MKRTMCMFPDKGFSLIEVSLVVLLSAILAGALVPNYVRSLHIEAARKTALEMSQITEALRAYHIEQGGWPAGLSELSSAGFLDNDWDQKNPFGNDYLSTIAGVNLKLETIVPLEMAPVVAGLVPMPSVQGASVAMTVTPPGMSAELIPAGTIVPWPAMEIPDGWLVCAGQAVSRIDHAKLFVVIGTTYGAGDGTNTFNLPDLRGRAVVGLDDMGMGAANVIALPLARVVGGVFGEEKHQLSIAEMPSHTHGYNESPWTGSRYDGHSSPLITRQVAAQTQAAGGSQAHNILQPSMALFWIIRT